MALRRIAFFILPLVAVGLLGALAGSATTTFVRVPRVSELETYRPDIITEIRGSDGSTIARYAIERRILLTRAEIPPVLRNAIVATEDKNFFQHGGVDLRRTVSALAANMRSHGYAQGGSTLTQQLARAIFLSPRKTISRKVNEALVAFEIERRYSKDQILTMYVNEIYLGHGNYGFEAASRYYFGKPVKEVTLAEAALLAGIVQRPEDQSPFRNPNLAAGRRATALRRMLAERYITEGQRTSAEAEPLPKSPSLKETVVAPYFCEEIRQYLERTYGEKDLYRRGLRVDSTLDPELQAWSEEALGWGLRRLARRHGFRRPRNLAAEGYAKLEAYVDPSWESSKLAEGDTLRGVVMSVARDSAEVRIGKQRFALRPSGYAWTGAKDATKLLKTGDLVTVTLQAPAKDGSALALDQDPTEQGAVLILENNTGAVRAMVGGYDWTTSKFNRATQALRQAGSTFKPFVYLAAMENGFTPSDTIFDGPISISIDPRQPPWQPVNYDRKFRGIVTLRRALEHSINVPTVRLAQLVGLQRVIEAAHRLGIHEKLQAYPSLALGAFEVSLIEMTSAYTVFANQGLAFPPYTFERITDANGDPLEKTHPDAREVTTPQASFQLLEMLKGVTQRGTGAAAAKLQLNIAGKTGTTSEYTDAWFIGMNPRYTVGVWIGNDVKTTLGSGMEGAKVALPVWMRIFEKMKEKGRIDPKADFEPPPNVVFTAVDYETGLKATPGSPRPIIEAFVSGSQPTEEWSSKWEEVTRLPWSLQKSFYLPKKGEEGGPEDAADPNAPAVAPVPAVTPGPKSP